MEDTPRIHKGFFTDTENGEFKAQVSAGAHLDSEGMVTILLDEGKHIQFSPLVAMHLVEDLKIAVSDAKEELTI